MTDADTIRSVLNALDALVAERDKLMGERERNRTEQVDVIREALKDYRSRLMDTFYPEDGDLFPDEADRALAALDALVAERDDLRYARKSVDHYRTECLELENRAEAAEAERDRWRAVACNVKDGTAAAEARVTELEAAHVSVMQSIAVMNDERAYKQNLIDRLQAEAARLREALEWYADIPVGEIPYEEGINEDPDIGKVARAALAAPTKEGTP